MQIPFVHFFRTRLRLSNPWRYKVPFLIAMPYWMIWVRSISPEKAAWGFLFSCMTILGIAGFGYLLNDFSDREEDRRAGKPNAVEGLAPFLLALLLLMLVALAVLPWLVFFPLDSLSYGLLSAEFVLFILYSLPPFRLKERGWAGLICDALYAHAVPTVLAAHTFSLMGVTDYPKWGLFFGVLGAWQFVLGLRNILLHQLQDREKDEKTGTRTPVVMAGERKAKTWLRSIFVPLELLGFAGFGLFVSLEIPWFSIVYVGFLLQVVVKRKWLWKQSLPSTLRQRLYIYLDDFYQQWIPLIFLACLVVKDPIFLLLGLFHVLLFPNALRTLAREIWNHLGPFLRRL